MKRAAPVAIPPLEKVCPAWPSPWRWEQPLPSEMERSRSIGASKVIARRGGREVRGVVVGSSAPAIPTVGDLLRHAESLCERSVRLDAGEGRTVTLSNARLRELNRRQRATEPGLRLSGLAAAEVAREARAALKRGNVTASDVARGSTLPFPHRKGSSPCSGPVRPATVARDLRAWKSGEGFESATEADMLARVRDLIPTTMRKGLRVESMRDARGALLAVEGHCVEAWETWANKATRSRREALREERAEVTASYGRKGKGWVYPVSVRRLLAKAG